MISSLNDLLNILLFLKFLKPLSILENIEYS